MPGDAPPLPVDVARAFESFPAPVRRRLLEIRRLIFVTAATAPEVGELTETLKWGEPAYLTEASGSGSTIRLGRLKSSERECAVMFNCRTTLIETFRARFADAFAYEGSRALLLSASAPLPRAELSACIETALTYHRRRR